MRVRSRSRWLLPVLCALGCSSSPDNGNQANASAGTGGFAGSTVVAGSPAAGTPAVQVPTAGTGGAAGATMPVAGATGSSGSMGGAGASGSGASSGAGGASGASGAGGASGTSGAGGAAGAGMGGSGGGGGMAAGNGSQLTGTLGALGPVEPILNGWATTNGLETLIYLTTAPLTCAQMMTMGTPWLRSLPAGSQVIEIVVRGMAMVGTTNVGFLQG